MVGDLYIKDHNSAPTISIIITLRQFIPFSEVGIVCVYTNPNNLPKSTKLNEIGPLAAFH